MINICLQIGFGLAPGTAVTIWLLCKRKAFHIKNVFLTLLLLLVCFLFTGTGIWQLTNNDIKKKKISQKTMITFANALFVEDACEEALEVLDEYAAMYGYDDECRILTARICLADGEYGRADGIYRILSIQSREAEFASAQSKNVFFKKTDSSDIRNAICNEIQKVYQAEESLQDCAAAVAALAAPGTGQTGDTEVSSSGRYRRIFDRIRQNSPELFDLECVKLAGLKASVLAGDFDGIVENLNDMSGYHAQMMAAELYMGGWVEQSDFSEPYRKIDADGVKAVKNQLNKICQKNGGKVSVQEEKKQKARADAIAAQLNDPVLAVLKEQLSEASLEEAGTDQTKVFLELAKVEYYFGNEVSADYYLSEAMLHSQESKDEAYASAMLQMLQAADNDLSELENIKNVSEYVETVLAHSLTVDWNQFFFPAMCQGRGEPAQDSGGHSFAAAAVDYVSRIKSAVSIGKIDTSEFPFVTAKVQISDDYIQKGNIWNNSLSVYDCGAKIPEFSVKKTEYTGSNILLCCDVSGSMEQSIQNLRDAVVTFISDKNRDENLSVVTFNESIVDTNAFGTPVRDLIRFAEEMQPDGGTDMVSAVSECLKTFPETRGTDNVLILLTDGQDSDPKNSDVIYKEIGLLAEKKNVTVYTLGLGTEVDTVYLNTIAKSGNGDFVYVSDSASLSSFYQMLHGQISNQYEISYMVMDEFTKSERTLEVALPSEHLRDVKQYDLSMESDNETDQLTQDRVVSGIAPRQCYKGMQEVNAKLSGTGFSEDSSVTVKLNGILDYTLDAVYESADSYRLVIPAGVATGVYNVEITIDGNQTFIQDGFTVLMQNDEEETSFGPYVFTSAEKIKNTDGSYTLRGAVKMNGWLHFKGDVVIEGDPDADSVIRVCDMSGSYVQFEESTAEDKLCRFLAKKGISLDIPALQEFRLYYDMTHIYDYSEYQADDISIGILKIHQLLCFDSPVIRLYPDRIGLFYKRGNTILPFQDIVFKLCGNEENIFQFEYDGSAQISDKNLGIVMDFSYKDPDKKEYNHKCNFLNAPVYFNGSVKVKINTIKDEYMVGAMVRFAFLTEGSGVGAEISWKDDFKLDSVKLCLELKEAIKLKAMIPIEMNHFDFQGSGLDDPLMRNWKFSGSLSLSSCRVKEYFPALEKFLGNISLFEMPNTTASIQFSPFQISFLAKLVFLGEITLAESEAKIGNFDYTNDLLNLNSVSVDGLSSRLKMGFIWNSANNRVNLEASGTGELDAHSRFVGIDFSGTVGADINWWLAKFKSDTDGRMALGLYTTHSGKKEFVLVRKYRDVFGKIKGNFYFIDENGHCGKDSGILN